MGPRTESLLEGAVDIHVHGGPDVIPRRHTDLELATRARDAGLRAIVLKSHHESTVGRAADVSEATGFTVLGGLVLNRFVVGDLEPDVVEVALVLGARIIWMPTLASASHVTTFGRGRGGWSTPTRPPAMIPRHVTVEPVDLGDRRTARKVQHIARLVRRADGVLASGHLALPEILSLGAIAAQQRARFLITHPDYLVPELSVGAQRTLARELPQAWFERCAYASSLDVSEPVPVERVVMAITATGPARNIVSSDLGQPGNPPYPDALDDFVSRLTHAGLSTGDVRRLIVDQPAQLIGLA